MSNDTKISILIVLIVSAILSVKCMAMVDEVRERNLLYPNQYEFIPENLQVN